MIWPNIENITVTDSLAYLQKKGGRGDSESEDDRSIRSTLHV
jgi:hypothetical protein